MDFLAFLVTNLWQKYRKLIRQIPANPLRNSCNIGHNFGPRNARKSIKGSEDSYYSQESNKVLSYKIGLSDQPMTSSKKTQNLPQSWRHQPKITHSKMNFFLILNYKTFEVSTGSEQPSSSIGWWVMVFSQNDQGYLLWDLDLSYLFEYKLHACISHTSILDLIKWYKIF